MEPTEEKREIQVAYVVDFGIEHYEPITIEQSANGWWMNQRKLYMLLSAFKMGMSIQEACNFATISIDQMKYFEQLYPKMRSLRKRLESEIVFRAMKSLNDGLEKNPRLAMRFLELRDPRFMSPTRRKQFNEQRAMKGLRPWREDDDNLD
jgi:hypothetical protein